MRWEDERYVRFYTRDTPEFMALSWQARGLFGLIMRKVDRAGLLPLGRLALKGVAIAISGPWVEVEAPLRELLDDGCVVFDEVRGVLVMPNFLEAQEARQSDRARKQSSRERARAVYGGSSSASEAARSALSEPPIAAPVTKRDDMASQNVTLGGHDPSHAVTRGHSQSHAVTPYCAVPSRTVPSRAVPSRAEGVQGAAPNAEGSASTPVLRVQEGTEPESKSRKRGRLPQTYMRDDWQPKPEHAKYVRDSGLDVAVVVEDFRNHWLAEGTLGANWDARFKQNVDRILRTDWLKPKFEARPEADDQGEPEPVYGPPADPSPEDVERLKRVLSMPSTIPPLLAEVLAADAIGAPVFLTRKAAGGGS